jgi:hypothetical protein
LFRVVAVIGFRECEFSGAEGSGSVHISVDLLYGTLEGSVEVLITLFDRTAESKLLRP